MSLLDNVMLFIIVLTFLVGLGGFIYVIFFKK